MGADVARRCFPATLAGAMRGIWLGVVFAGLAFAAGACVPASAGEPADNARKGEQLFLRCAACHSTHAADRRTGPQLEAIVGRKAASLPHYPYTAALRAQSFVWEEQRLHEWLEKPQAKVPGMCLPFRGFARAEDRGAMVAYLRQAAP